MSWFARRAWIQRMSVAHMSSSARFSTTYLIASLWLRIITASRLALPAVALPNRTSRSVSRGRSCCRPAATRPRTCRSPVPRERGLRRWCLGTGGAVPLWAFPPSPTRPVHVGQVEGLVRPVASREFLAVPYGRPEVNRRAQVCEHGLAASDTIPGRAAFAHHLELPRVDQSAKGPPDGGRARIGRHVTANLRAPALRVIGYVRQTARSLISMTCNPAMNETHRGIMADHTAVRQVIVSQW